MEKAQLRSKILALRDEQSTFRKRDRDAKILLRLERFSPFHEAGEFFTYLSHRGEVATDALIQKFFTMKKVVVPKMREEKIELFELPHPEKFVKGKFGIREPKISLPKSQWSEISVAIIPGIAFDLKGNRIGFGGGHFDRLLKKLRCTTIALAYEFQIVDKVPTHKYDVPVDYIVTEKRVIHCKK